VARDVITDLSFGVWAGTGASAAVGGSINGGGGVHAEYNSSVVVEGDITAAGIGVDAYHVGIVHVKGDILLTEYTGNSRAGVYVNDNGPYIEDACIHPSGGGMEPGSVITVDGSVTASGEAIRDGDFYSPLRGVRVANIGNTAFFPVVRIGGDVTVSGTDAQGVEMESDTVTGSKVTLDGNLTVNGRGKA
jgi:hypothetical protein